MSHNKNIVTVCVSMMHYGIPTDIIEMIVGNIPTQFPPKITIRENSLLRIAKLCDNCKCYIRPHLASDTIHHCAKCQLNCCSSCSGYSNRQCPNCVYSNFI